MKLAVFLIIASALHAEDFSGIWVGQIPTRNGETQDIAFQFYNKVHDYASLTGARVYYLGTTLRRATNLIALLKKNYEID